MSATNPKQPAKSKQKRMDKKPKARIPSQADTEPDWSGECEVCGQSPIMPLTGMCGPCTFGEAETLDGNW